ncbi:MAG: hypothetical protein A3E87_02960 [Gammaproteobacteria bacterium RIFCSPHIGHO2_12_FULL_35_23]|nr:MAG: hypothetical protein A3E87_02960 [Gammaproteobacteria bacterium RIFCSPHIGHO2_12_FULL_35_23]
MRNRQSIEFLRFRYWIVVGLLLLIVLAIVLRMIYLTVIDRGFLVQQADERILRDVPIPAYRGMILSADGIPLAVSIPVDSIWINPQEFKADYQNIIAVSSILKISPNALQKLLHRNAHKLFIYIVRDINENEGNKITALNMPGIYTEQEYHRYYPEGPITAHVVGYTNIDDAGQAGLELAYNDWLHGIPGKRSVVKDRLGNIVAVMDTISHAKPGRNLILSLNDRIQFLTFQVLQQTISQYKAESGSAVVVNPKTGEILAMVNFPTFNPNKPYSPPYDRYRNRAVTDMFEPGSTMKTFSIANALESGKFLPATEVDTNPGWFIVGDGKVRDEKNNGVINVIQILQRSSNVGVAKMNLLLPPNNLINLLQRLGFGERTASGFPGESDGVLPYKTEWRPFDYVTLTFGYGIDVTTLQLAQAYTAIANQGKICPITFLKRSQPVTCQQAMDPELAHEMLLLLEQVVKPTIANEESTGTQAAVPGYRVAGKTGTSYIAAGSHGYTTGHNTLFVGIAPVSDPQLVIAIIIRDPQNMIEQGGIIAAPAFSKIMAGSLRILNIPPDQLESLNGTKTSTPFPEAN